MISIASSSISWRMCTGGQPRPTTCSFRFSPAPTPSRKRPSLITATVAARHLLERLKEGGEVAPLVAERLCALEHLVGTLGGRQWDLESSRRVERQLDVLVHEAEVEPRLFGRIENDRRSRPEHRRAD